MDVNKLCQCAAISSCMRLPHVCSGLHLSLPAQQWARYLRWPKRISTERNMMDKIVNLDAYRRAIAARNAGSHNLAATASHKPKKTVSVFEPALTAIVFIGVLVSAVSFVRCSLPAYHQELAAQTLPPVSVSKPTAQRDFMMADISREPACGYTGVPRLGSISRATAQVEGSS